MLSCLFWESLSLVSWYLETARNFGFHSHSNRKKKNLNAFQILVSQMRTAWLQSGLLPHSLPPLINSQRNTDWKEKKKDIIDTLSHKLKLPLENARQQDSLHISWCKKASISICERPSKRRGLREPAGSVPSWKLHKGVSSVLCVGLSHKPLKSFR